MSMLRLLNSAKVIGLICLVVVGVGSVTIFNRTVGSLWQANPSADVEKALSKGDRRFVGVYGFNLAVPAVPDGEANSLVELHGVNPIPGTGDFFPSLFQSRAVAYATEYNQILLRSLLSQPDSKTRKLLAQIRKEIQTLERSDPRKDSLRSFKSASPEFIIVAGERSLGIPESSLDADPIVVQTDMRWLKSNSLVLSGSDKKRFQKALQKYVISYNKNLYLLLKQQKRHHN